MRHCFGLLVVCAWMLAGAAHAQPAVRASGGWVQATAPGATATNALVTVENTTMYDVYIVNVQSDAAGAAELRQTTATGAAERLKEVSVAAYNRLEMEPKGVHIHLSQLKRPLKSGDQVGIDITVDNGTTLSLQLPVR